VRKKPFAKKQNCEKDVEMENSPKELTETQKWAVVAYSNFIRSVDTLQLEYGALEHIAGKFNVTKARVKRICSEYTSQCENVVYPDLNPRKKGRCGRKTTLNDEIQKDLIEINRRTKGELTFRMLLEAYNNDHEKKLTLRHASYGD
jgi:hypothetical protein